jgi:glycosyltransferase involved in cell wall biosynthesis
VDLLLISECPPYPLNHPHRGLIYHLAAELSARRHVIDLLCFYDQPEDYAYVPRYSQYFRSVELIPHPEISMDDLRQRADNPRQQYPGALEEAWSPEMWTTVENWVSDRHYHFVQVFGGVAIYEYFPLFQSLPNACVILRQQVTTGKRRASNRSEHRRHEMLGQYEEWIYKRYDSTIVFTQELAREYRSGAAEGVATLPTGVDTEHFVPTGQESQEPNLLFVGDFTHPEVNQAALQLCRETFATIKRSIPQANLFIVGRHPSPELWACASDSITVTGYVPDLRPYIDLAMLYIHPVETSFGIVPEILQALAMLTPVVTTSAGCEGLQLRHNEHLMVANSSVELAKYAILMLCDDQLRLRLQSRGRERVIESYGWEPIVSRYEALYERIITARRG